MVPEIQLPTEWIQIQVKDAFKLGRGRVISKKEIQSNPGPYPVYSSQSKNNGMMGALGSYDFEGDFVTWTTDGAYAGTVFCRSGKFNCTNVCGTLKDNGLHEINYTYAAYQLGMIAKNYVAYVGNPKLMNNVFAEIPLVLPPLPEQKKIAAILGSVDEAIQATQAVIDQTHKVKQGLLQQLLTRGIGHTRFKQTEIGEIPEGWEVGQLENYCERICVGFVGTCEKHYRSSGIPMVRTGNLKDGYLDLSTLKYVTAEFHQKNKKSQMQEGDLLIARHGNHGQAALVPDDIGEANCLNIVIVRADKRNFEPAFLQYAFNSPAIRESIESRSAGSTQKVINTRQIAQTIFPKPSLLEQQKISGFLQSLDHAITFNVENLLQLNLSKNGLMQDLLTGRVRVKDFKNIETVV